MMRTQSLLLVVYSLRMRREYSRLSDKPYSLGEAQSMGYRGVWVTGGR